jgi:uncharacterized membrane protein YgdD (TMEM256/DUF423 family)
MGAAGVGLAAAAAHGVPGAALESAAYLLVFHAVAVLAGAALLDKAQLWRPALIAALTGWVAGSALFSADIASRTFAGQRLFPLAAPTGGTLLIIAWLALAVAGVAVARKRK